MTLKPSVKEQMIKEQLKYFGFKFTGDEATDAEAISQLKLSDEAKAFVWKNYNLESFALISNHKPIVAALNTFFERGSKIEVNYNVGTGDYNHNGNEGKGLLRVERNLLWSKNEKGEGHRDDQIEGVLTLIHELTHAFQPAPPKLGDTSDEPELSLNDYVDAYVSIEGEALYYEFMSFQILYPDNNEFFKDMQEKEDLEVSSKNIYDRVKLIMDGYSPDKKSTLVDDFTEIMRENIGAHTRESNVPLTYDEKHKIDWLLTYTDIGIDYLKTVTGDSNLYGTRFQAKGAIYENKEYIYDLKTLVNLQANSNYFGTNEGETIEAIEGGSARGKKNGYDVLWGGGGNDTLKGSSGHDLLIGGADNDELYGGKDDDHLYGGSGVNHLDGGQGYDSYYLELGALNNIVDEDMLGQVLLSRAGADPAKLTGGELQGAEGAYPKVYISEDGYQYIHFSTDSDTKSGTLVIMAGGLVVATIKDFVNGNLDINLTLPEDDEDDEEEAEDKEKNKKNLLGDPDPNSIAPDVNSNFQGALKVNAPGPPLLDPLALDLDGDGVETVGEGAGIFFDHNGDGIKKVGGWVKGDDGFLVFDRNGDKVINDGSELFGDNTVRYDGSGTCLNAFEALAQEDTNGDGLINNLDQNWGQLKVWRDLNQDGLSQANELFTLEKLGITSLNLDQQNMNKLVPGGRQTAWGTYTKADGSTGLTGQFDFSENPFYREFTDEIEIPTHLQNLSDLYLKQPHPG